MTAFDAADLLARAASVFRANPSQSSVHLEARVRSLALRCEHQSVSLSISVSPVARKWVIYQSTRMLRPYYGVPGSDRTFNE